MVTVLANALANPSDGAPRFPFFGNTTYYTFNDTIDSSVTSITIQGTYTEAINQNLFVVPSMSFVNVAAGPKVLVRAAVSLPSLAPRFKLTFAVIDHPILSRHTIDRHLALSLRASRLSISYLQAGSIQPNVVHNEGRLHDISGKLNPTCARRTSKRGRKLAHGSETGHNPAYTSPSYWHYWLGRFYSLFPG